MAIQETHLTPHHVDDLNRFHKHLKIWNTAVEDNPTGSGGVALVFNKVLTNTETVAVHEIVPGRAILATWEWHRGDRMTVLAVYAPTNHRENRKFWADIETRIRNSRDEFPKPDVVLGDFNMVEDEIDRFPARLNSIDCPDSFGDLKRYLKISDGWRETFPSTKEWTWRNRPRSSMSRIDRIYLTREMSMASRNWEIVISGLNANDHSRISVEVVNLDAPIIGPGRWTMTPDLATDKRLLKSANVEARKAWKEMLEIRESGRTEARNPQLVWKHLKATIIATAKRRRREIAGARASKVNTKLRERDEAKQRLGRATRSPEREQAQKDLEVAENAIHDLKSESQKLTFDKRDARKFADAETMTKSWFSWAKENKPRDTMTTLKKPASDPVEYVHDSQAMANVAAKYHDEIQMRDLDVDEERRSAATAHVLTHVNRPMQRKDRARTEAQIAREDILESLKAAKNGSAAGIDGIIYEFWKEMNRKFDATKGSESEWVDIVLFMTEVYIDVEEFGVDEKSNFADGWLCPIYKKGDRTEIENYRPITLLNTDYKIYTKALALKLAAAAPSMIHETQAGFVRGRSITNLTKITALILDYAEAYEKDGMIIALDQEKAYDRIRHDYLSETLRTFKIPERMITAVESLYSNAYTVVMINGCVSKRYKVTRGVRQGDPLSCLLFDLAIEPLAAMLRASQLRGYRIEGLAEKLIATLYADDTTVYLSKWDSFEHLDELLTTWCLASGAKFNTNKTEIIPMGTQNYRATFLETRRMREDGDMIPEGIRIARDGEPTRILGTWPGNGVKVANAWSKVTERVQNTLDNWSRHNPTLNGRAMLSRMMAGGFTQYLTAAQGMPRSIESKIDKIVMDFFWKSAKRHPINMRMLRGEIEHGGLGLFCAEERNEAQYLTWIGMYLSRGTARPTWAFLADQLFRAAVIKVDEQRLSEEMRVNPFYQNWKVNSRRLPFMLQQMIRVAKKYNIAFDAPFIPQEVRESATIWSHPALMDPQSRNRRPWTVRCLKTNHAVKTVEDLEEIAELDEVEHEQESSCGCENCTDDRMEGCRHPYRCQEMASELIGQIAEKWNPSLGQMQEPTSLWDAFEDQRNGAIANGEMIVFEKHASVPNCVEDMGRAFVHSIGLDPAPAEVIMRRDAGQKTVGARTGEKTQVIICAGMTKDSTDDARGGFAIHFPDGDYTDAEQACAGSEQTYIRALALGMIKAITHYPHEQDNGAVYDPQPEET